MKYDFKEIEKKWQDVWDEKQTFKAENNSPKPKYYCLVEFPYPSGQGLHVGHPRSYTALDIVARKKRLEGYNVLYPMGWDAFGLPTENFAIEHKMHPADVTRQNVANFKSQLKALGLSFDWSREINTADPNYYRWTQWIFLRLFKKGLAYKKEMTVNWCTHCKVVLANEEVVNGGCERCHGEVVRKVKSQWMLKITDYADKLLDDLDTVNFIEKVKTAERNWIGRSYGAEVDFTTTKGDTLRVFTTRPDTLFGATYMVISSEHPLIEERKADIENYTECIEYREAASKKSDFERTEMVKVKTGVKLLGIEAINPVNNNRIPIYVSDYVLMSYGTGAIMAVPAHDERDYEFATTFSLPMIEVVAGGDISKEAFTDIQTGIMINSGMMNGLSVSDAKEKIIDWLVSNKKGERKINYKLRDWVFARQRYWGEPVPLVWCEKCGWVPIPESELPLMLPNVDSYELTENGESPLAKIESFVNTTCPKCGKPAKRETDTMPGWAGSSWYFLRYCDPNNDKVFADKKALDYWMPVDWYNGGMEHATLHLLYSRFWAKFLYDEGLISCPEPYIKRTAHGMILGEDGEKMSKSRGNVVNPDDIVRDFGADTLRLYEMFIGDFEKTAPWSSTSIKGCKRFLEKVFGLTDIVSKDASSKEIESLLHKTIKKVIEDIEAMKYNTAIAAMMTYINEVYAIGKINKEDLKSFIIILNPFAPHLTEEIWLQLKFKGMVNEAVWPSYDINKTIDSVVVVPVQINGKLRTTVSVETDSDEAVVLAAAKNDDKVISSIEGKTIVKVIYIKNKMLNIVIK